MAYLGNAPARSFISFERQVFTIVNSQTAYTLDHSVNNENDLRLVINNIVQEPGSGKAYTASGTTLTLSAALTNGTDEMYCVFLGRATATNAPGAGSVNTAAIAADAITEAKIADDAVESEHLNDNVVSGQTELAAEPADTDEFLVSDAGTLKRVDYSYIKGGGITMADQWRLTTTLSQSSLTTAYITANWERVDTDAYGKIGTGMSESSGEFSFPSTGLYSIDFRANFFITGTSSKYNGIKILVTTNNSTYNVASEDYDDAESIYAQGNTASNIFVNVTDISNIKVKFQFRTGASNADLEGNTGANRTYVSFVRLGDSV